MNRSIGVLVLALAILALPLAAVAQSAPADRCVWEEMFPDGLINAKGEKVPVHVLEGKLVGVYFSGHWCPDCRRFSPRLITFRGLNQADFEVVFVSYDRSEKDFFNYMTSFKMEWPALAWKSAPAEALKQKFEVKSIPMLVVVAPNGKVITKEGVQDVTNAPETCLQAWKANAAEPAPVPAADAPADDTDDQ